MTENPHERPLVTDQKQVDPKALQEILTGIVAAAINLTDWYEQSSDQIDELQKQQDILASVIATEPSVLPPQTPAIFIENLTINL